MKVGIISIGDEILSGYTINTNASWIGKKLTNIGCTIDHQITIKDKSSSIFNALEYACSKQIDYIILTGGLGPTDDDLTRETLFKFVSADSVFDKDYWELLKTNYKKKTGLNIPKGNKNQALIPSKGKIIPNSFGTARGFQFNVKNILIISLPGVPFEMKKMMNELVLPQIQNSLKKLKYTKTIKTFGLPETKLAEKISKSIKIDKFINCRIGYYPSVFGVDIRISSYSNIELEKFILEINNILKTNIYSLKNEPLEQVLVKIAIEKNKTIAIAESCTGGLISNRITNVAGSSKIFKGSVISYSNQSKIKFLNVDEKIINKFGAVSREVANLMAINTLKLFSTDYAISVTGIAGPTGGSNLKPVGLVYIGLSNFNETKVKKFQFGINREINKIKTSQVALNWLRMSFLNE